MIAVLAWVDGFGHDTCVIGIANSQEDARKIFQSTYNECETRFQEVIPNTKQWFDWYDGKPLFDKKKRGKRNGK